MNQDTSAGTADSCIVSPLSDSHPDTNPGPSSLAGSRPDAWTLGLEVTVAPSTLSASLEEPELKKEEEGIVIHGEKLDMASQGIVTLSAQPRQIHHLHLIFNLHRTFWAGFRDVIVLPSSRVQCR